MTMVTIYRLLRLAVPLAFLLILPVGRVWAETRRPVAVIELNGMIDSISSRHVVRAIDAAERSGRELIVIQMDTPGGLDTAMREIIRRILRSGVPIAVFVGPEGARAASAGLFVTMAAHIAVMAPSTNIRAAHPVSLGGDQSGQSAVLESKVTNDAAAYIRGIAESRGRNAEWAERAVRESVSITATEALELGVIDLIASDVGELLRLVDGREVATASAVKTLRTAGSDHDVIGMNAVDSFLHVLVDPNIAFLLFSIGGAAIIAEVLNPGIIFPGVAGAISLILAFVSFGSLPVNWTGIALIVLALALFATEAFVGSNGVLVGGGVVARILGALFLFQAPEVAGPILPEVRVSRVLISVVGVMAATIALILFRTGVAARRAVTAMRAIPMRDSIGQAQSALRPTGTVLIESEEWCAESQGGRIRKGQQVKVLGSPGLTLLVESMDPKAPAETGENGPAGESDWRRRGEEIGR